MPSPLAPEVISRIKGYDLKSKRLVEGMTEGMHKSRLRGMSTSFAQHRAYVPGDDTRHLDWKVFAKTDRFFIKQYEAETNLTCHFLIDASKSMFFKSREEGLSKFEYAATVVATLAHLVMGQKDRFGLTVFDDKVRSHLPPASTGSHFRMIVEALDKTEAKGKTNLSEVLLALGPQIRRKGLVFLVSDFVDDLEPLALGLSQLVFTGQDVALIHVEDPAERDFLFAGQTIFLGPEGEGKLICEPSDLRSIYLDERGRHLAQLFETARRFGFHVEPMSTDKPLDEALSSFLSVRAGAPGR